MSVEVKQIDREAAADSCPFNLRWGTRARAGECDDNELVQAFAAHRHQAEEAMRERAAALVEQRLQIMPTLTDLAANAVLVCIPDAIRSIDTRGE